MLSAPGACLWPASQVICQGPQLDGGVSAPCDHVALREQAAPDSTPRVAPERCQVLSSWAAPKPAIHSSARSLASTAVLCTVLRRDVMCCSNAFRKRLWGRAVLCTCSLRCSPAGAVLAGCCDQAVVQSTVPQASRVAPQRHQRPDACALLAASRWLIHGHCASCTVCRVGLALRCAEVMHYLLAAV